MPKCPKISLGADAQVAVVAITGDPRRQEPQGVRISFPGGEVELVRAVDGEGADYWVHVRVVKPGDSEVVVDGATPAILTDARLDIQGRHTSEVNVGDFGDPRLYHLAVRVTREPS